MAIGFHRSFSNFFLRLEGCMNWILISIASRFHVDLKSLGKGPRSS